MAGQRGSLGLSIAGGKGSLPYKNHDEVSADKLLRLLVIHLSQKSHFPNVFVSAQGIFISRVVQGGASEKAGIHVGDRLLEVEEIFL